MRTIRVCGYLREMVLQYALVKRVTAFHFKCKKHSTMKLSVQGAEVAKRQIDFLAEKNILYRQTLVWIVCVLQSFLDPLAQDSGRKRSQDSVFICWAVS